MQAWYLNENPYPFVPQDVLDRADSVRASLPNKYCDPKLAADLFEEALASTSSRTSTTPASTVSSARPR